MSTHRIDLSFTPQGTAMHYGSAFIGFSGAPISDAAVFPLKSQLAQPSDIVETFRGKELTQRATAGDAAREPVFERQRRRSAHLPQHPFTRVRKLGEAHSSGVTLPDDPPTSDRFIPTTLEAAFMNGSISQKEFAALQGQAYRQRYAYGFPDMIVKRGMEMTAYVCDLARMGLFEPKVG